MEVDSPVGGPTVVTMEVPCRPAVRVVLAEDQALLRDGLTRILEAGGFAVAAAVDNAPTLEAALAEHDADVAVVDVRMPPTFTTEGLAAAIAAARRPPGVAGAGAQPVRRAALRPRAAGQPARAPSATCSRTGSPTSTSSWPPCARSPTAARSSTPRWSPRLVAAPAQLAAGPAHRPRAGGARR